MKSRKGPVALRDRAGADASNRRPEWWRHPALGCAFLALLLYLPVTRFAFIRDDRELFADNPFLRNPGYLLRLLTSDFWSTAGADSGLWRPLISLSYWVDGRLGGWLPVWYHTVNLLSHVLVTALLAMLMVEVGAGAAAAWIAALWFAVMTAHVESVAWISGRTDVWCALFGLLALWLHERGARAGDRIWTWRIAAALAFALALLSKESSVTLLAPLALLILVRLGAAPGRFRGMLLELSPYAVLAVVWTLAHRAIAPGAMASTPGWPHPGSAERLWTSLAVLPSELAFLLPGFPHGPDWWISPARSGLDPRVALGILLHLGALILIVRGLRPRSRVGAATAMLWLPIVMIALVTLLRGVLVQGERNMYLPSAGAAWLVGITGWRLWRRGLAPTTLPRVLLPIAYALILAVGIEQSLVQLSAWRTEELMYRAMVRAQPDRADGHLGLALVMIGQRRDRVAIEALRRAEAIDSTRYEIATYRAAIATRQADWPEVIRWSRNALRRGATESDAWLMEINALQELKLLPFSRVLVETLMVHHKSDPDVAAAFARQMIAEDIPARAVKPLRYAIGWNPDDASLRIQLGDALLKLKHFTEAREEFRHAVGIEPGNVGSWMRLAVCLHELNDFDGRDQALETAASLPGADRDRINMLYHSLLTEIRPYEPPK